MIELLVDVITSDNLSEDEKETVEYMINILDLRNSILLDIRKNMLSDVISRNED